METGKTKHNKEQAVFEKNSCVENTVRGKRISRLCAVFLFLMLQITLIYAFGSGNGIADVE